MSDVQAPPVAAPEPSTRHDSEPLELVGVPFRGPGLVVIAVLAALISRALGPALLGSRSGIDTWIMRLETGNETLPGLGAFLTQTTQLCAGWLCVHFVMRVLADSRGPLALRTLITFSGSLLFAIVALANVAVYPLDEPWLLTMAGCALLLSVIAAWQTARHPVSRATCIALLLVTLAAALHLISRSAALHASVQARAADFTLAQRWATAAFVTNCAATLFALYWLLHGRERRWQLLSLLGLLPGALVVWAASGAARPGASFLQVLSAGSLSQLRTHPDPLVLAPLRDLAELSGFAVALLVLTRPRTPSALRAAVGLALVSRASIDTPLCALLLACAALLAAAFTREALPGIATRSETAQSQGTPVQAG